MKKIAIVVNSSWYAWNMRVSLGSSLQKEGYEVVFICPYDKYAENIKKNFDYINIDIDANGVNPIKDLRTIYRYYTIYKKIRPDVVLQYTIKPNIYGTIAASILKIPAINNIAGLGTLFIKQNIVTKIAKLLYKISQSKATKIFFQNQDDFNMFTNERLVQKEKCDVLPGSGVNIDKFIPVKNNNNGVFIFLLASRMLWAKGIQEFVDAAKIIKAKHKNIEFQLLGRLDAVSSIAISKKQMDVWIADGYVKYLDSSDDVRIEIAKADCMVLPSFYREGTPRILLESASMEKPIITTDNVGCRDVVDDGINGYLCEVRNSQDLAEKMEIMLCLSRDERRSMGVAGRIKMINEFNEKIVIDKYQSVVKSVLN
jgi:glycosyltransferase involved in cell wall biosynthesis